ncbi:hypothetical protein SAMN04488168_1098 [Bacillus sp. 491mf]|nr:hypothetical protein SAMN04488168_1098 [Bacillus sp. 491mf]
MYLYFKVSVLYNERRALHFILGGKTMNTENRNEQKAYTRPMVLSSQPIRFETAQSWNKGHGNLDHPGHGNGGIHYPNPPYTGPHKGNGGGHGGGKRK